MLAEKDDWIPREVAPFIWANQEATEAQEADSTNPLGQPKTKPKPAADPIDRTERIKDVVHVHHPAEDPILKPASSQTQNTTLWPTSSSDTKQANPQASSPSSTSEEVMTRGSSFGDEHASVSSEEDARPRRVGRRARMMDLGRKMGEMLEEKRRHIEEKSRHIVEKMMENSSKSWKLIFLTHALDFF